jgi:hypothetical protein
MNFRLRERVIIFIRERKMVPGGLLMGFVKIKERQLVPLLPPF